MFLFTQPTTEQIHNILLLQSRLECSYPAVGASQGAFPAGYQHDYNRVRLGYGLEVFQHAVAALQRWEMFHLGWVQICWPDTPIVPGNTVAMLATIPGLWILNACKIVYVFDDDGPTKRYGFAYGTLPDHVARGEERFMVEWDHADNAVYYDIRAFSQPNQLLACLGYPIMRLMQKRFVRDSKRAMLAAIHKAPHVSPGTTNT